MPMILWGTRYANGTLEGPAISFRERAKGAENVCDHILDKLKYVSEYFLQ